MLEKGVTGAYNDWQTPSRFWHIMTCLQGNAFSEHRWIMNDFPCIALSIVSAHICIYMRFIDLSVLSQTFRIAFKNPSFNYDYIATYHRCMLYRRGLLKRMVQYNTKWNAHFLYLRQYIYHTRPIVSRGCGWCLVMNIHNPFMHCATS